MKSEEKRLIYFQQLRVHHSGVPGGDITTSRSCPRSIMVTNIFTKLEDNQAKNIDSKKNYLIYFQQRP